MFALTRILVFVESSAIEPGEAVLVFREVGGNPVHNHADAGLVAAVDKVAEAPGRGIKADRLVAPGAVKRVFGYRQ